MGVYLGTNKVNMLGGITIAQGGIDTSDATATSVDIASGKTTYVDGKLVTGTVNEITSDNSNMLIDSSPSVSGSNLRLNAQNTNDILMRNGSWNIIDSPLSNFGDATAEDVTNGKTFTSSKGLKIVGTHICDGGLDTSDATAIASDIALDKTAYVNNELVTGILKEGSPSKIVSGSNVASCNVNTTIETGTKSSFSTIFTPPQKRILYKTATVSDGKIVLSDPLNEEGSSASEQKSNYSTYKYFYGDLIDGTNDPEVYKYTSISTTTTTSVGMLTSWSYTFYHLYLSRTIYITATSAEDTIIRENSDYKTYITDSNFGNATASDVARGKTFTSMSGLKIAGTGARLLTSVNGTSSSSPFETGLYRILYFILYPMRSDKVGLTHAVFHNSTSDTITGHYTYCTKYTSSDDCTFEYGNDTSIITIDGGTVTWNGIDSQGLSGSSYYWVAVGYKSS